MLQANVVASGGAADVPGAAGAASAICVSRIAAATRSNAAYFCVKAVINRLLHFCGLVIVATSVQVVVTIVGNSAFLAQLGDLSADLWRGLSQPVGSGMAENWMGTVLYAQNVG